MNFIRTSLLGLLALPLAAQGTGFSAGGGLILAPSKQLFGSYEKTLHNNLGFALNGAYDFKLYQTDVDARATLSVASMPGKESNYNFTTPGLWVAEVPATPTTPKVDGYFDDKVSRRSLKTDLTLIQVTGDVFLSLGSENLRALFGFSLNSYSAKFTGQEDILSDPARSTFTTGVDAATNDKNYDHSHKAFLASRANQKGHFAFKDCDGIKLGFRIGLDYAITKSLSAEVIFQQTELAGSDLSEQVSLTTATAFVRAGGVSPSWLQFGVRYHF